MNLASDKRSVTLHIDGTFTADEISALIADLAALRSDMEPPVPSERPIGEHDRIAVLDTPHSIAKPLRGLARCRLYFRSPGLGWMAYRLSAEQSVALRHVLDLAGPPDFKVGQLVDHQLGDPH